MSTKIRHVAIVTENYDRMARFYQTIFGMKKITNGMTDETGNYNPNRGHISDGIIGLALLQRQPGAHAGLDHFGLEVEDVKKVEDRLQKNFPEHKLAKRPGHVPFAGLRNFDPSGSQFDLSQKEMSNVREGYTQAGWDQPRHLSHIAIRASKPRLVAEFYQKVYELEVVDKLSDNNSFCLTDGKVSLVIRPWDMVTYSALLQGLDHIGFKVENLEEVKSEFDEMAKSYPESAPRKIAVGREGENRQKNLEACQMCSYATSDPDGVLLDLSV